MTESIILNDLLKDLPTSDKAESILCFGSQGNPYKPSQRYVANKVFATVSSNEDLDNPTTKGIFSVTQESLITRPTNGSGWQYGFVINLAITTGIQIWINYSGFIAVRGKGSSGGQWSEWTVMQKM